MHNKTLTLIWWTAMLVIGIINIHIVPPGTLLKVQYVIVVIFIINIVMTIHSMVYSDGS